MDLDGGSAPKRCCQLSHGEADALESAAHSDDGLREDRDYSEEDEKGQKVHKCRHGPKLTSVPPKNTNPREAGQCARHRGGFR